MLRNDQPTSQTNPELKQILPNEIRQKTRTKVHKKEYHNRRRKLAGKMRGGSEWRKRRKEELGDGGAEGAQVRRGERRERASGRPIITIRVRVQSGT